MESLQFGLIYASYFLHLTIEAATVPLNPSCSHKPLPCVMTYLGINVRHACDTDADCFPGKQCCYHGCTRTCELWDPCQAVVCNAGFTCQIRYSYKWIPEADCIPDEQKLCPTLHCNGLKHCPPGYKTQLDKDGCPTCHCELKENCRDSGCRLLCAHGLETRPDGCPLCRCKKPPGNPCSNLKCAAHEECRLTMPAVCSSPPCHPIPQCVQMSRKLPLFDNTCSSWDPSTVHLPVVSTSCPAGPSRNYMYYKDSICELDCRRQACPERTVCVKMGRVQRRCCWQSTQALLLPQPESGECPQDILLDAVAAFRWFHRRPYQRCQIDAQCPGQQKCCSFTRRSNRRSPNGDKNGLVGKTISVSRYCMDPTHKLLDELRRPASGLHP